MNPFPASSRSFALQSRAFALVMSMMIVWLPSGRADATAPTVIHALNGASEGASPHAPLALAADGSFYGVASEGGAAAGTFGKGTVFKVTAAGALTTLAAFANDGSGGSNPNSLVLAADGNLYGTAASGGANGYGTVFKVTPSGTLTTLWSFIGGDDGAAPNGLALATDGNLYGTTGDGGANAYGTIFKVTTAGVLTTIHAFTGGEDGAVPQAALVPGSDGSLYGTTAYGGGTAGYAGSGTVFAVTTAGAVTTLHAFNGGGDGSYPMGTLVEGTDGNFYGTTSGSAGGDNHGTVFQAGATGAFTTLHAFTGSADGDGPVGGLVQAADGNLYGTTHTGGLNSDGTLADGTLFAVSTAGALTTVATFGGGGASNGASTPYAALSAGSDGNLYGTTVNGGSGNGGTVFQVAISGAASLVSVLGFSTSTYSAPETAGTATITVTRTGSGAGAVSVAYTAAAGTATAGTDFTPASGTLTWADGDRANKTFTVAVLNDTASTADHTVLLTLGGASGSGAALGTAAGMLTIADSASATATPIVEIAVRGDGLMVESGERGKTLVTRSGGDTSAALTVYYTLKGTAVNGTDYGDADGVALTGAVVIPAGETKTKLKLKALTTPTTGRRTVKILLQADPASTYKLGSSIKAKLLLINPSTYTF